MSAKRDSKDLLRPVIVLLLFLASMISYTDRSVLGVVMPNVRRDLGLSHAEYAVATHAFLVMYAVFYILGGRIADRFGYRRTFTLTLLFWSMATAAHALVRGLRSLFLCQAMLGMGEGSYYPTAMRGVAELFSPASRAKAVGTILSAISLGLLVSPPLVAWTTLHYGWRMTFAVLGVAGSLLVPLWVWFHRQRPRDASALRTAPEGALPQAAAGNYVSLNKFLRARKYWCVLSARACADTAWYFYLFWVAGYFQDVRGLSLVRVGQLLWVPYLAACAGPLTGAAASSALIRRSWGQHRSRLTAMLAFASMAVLGATAGIAPTTNLALALVSLALFAHQALGTNIHTVVTEIVPPRHVAMLYGVTGAAGTFIGAAAQLVIGPLIDRHGYSPCFLWAGGMYVLAIILLLTAGTLEPLRPIDIATAAQPDRVAA